MHCFSSSGSVVGIHSQNQVWKKVPIYLCMLSCMQVFYLSVGADLSKGGKISFNANLSVSQCTSLFVGSNFSISSDFNNIYVRAILSLGARFSLGL